MNLILATDSYKLTHWNQYPTNTEAVYSYFESRGGAQYPSTVFFGLQSILFGLAGDAVTEDDVLDAQALAEAHFGSADMFNYDGWMHIVNRHAGQLPLRIKAVPEGTVVPTGNVLMTVENTDPACYWLTNAVESLLTHVWAPSTVATRSYHVKQMIARYLENTADSLDSLPFMLHDFGYRGVTSHESAGICGAGHLINFLGTDTLPAMEVAAMDYSASYEGLAYSVPATEHSIMTSLGRDGESVIVGDLLNAYPSGILSVVADSYDIYGFVQNIVCDHYKDEILGRDGVFVVRPDSITPTHTKPEQLVVWILAELWEAFGGVKNSKGFKVLDPHVRVLWGDGIDEDGIDWILFAAMEAGFSAENLVFGMGGGLLQKLNRDTQRFAFKSSAQKRAGVWHDVYKQPKDISKASKAGRLRLTKVDGEYVTVSNSQAGEDLLQTVFEDGRMLNVSTFQQVRERALQADRHNVKPAITADLAQ